MSTGYQIYDQSATYFLTFQIVDWVVDIFTRQIYRDIVLDSFKFCREQKGLNLYAYVIMSNHIHCIASAKNGNLSDVVRDFKRHTSNQIHKAILNTAESRRNWMLTRFEFASRSNKRSADFQLWTHENHAIEISSEKFLNQKMAYIHENPTRAALVAHAGDWLYSSQRNYSDLTALIDIDKVDL